ncbi:MAG: hypothetical protein IJ141_00075 [Lachnospiraceae bacterium]|nr:hypothetical protein [Lachnospiraceae bacterium]
MNKLKKMLEDCLLKNKDIILSFGFANVSSNNTMSIENLRNDKFGIAINSGDFELFIAPDSIVEYDNIDDCYIIDNYLTISTV